MRLLPGIFGTEFNPPAPDKRLFGLRAGQMRSYPDKIGHNAGWYNGRGEKIGWGDLSREDALCIRSQLMADEIFIILSESESFWAFAKTIGPTGGQTTTEPREAAPGIDYVVAHAFMVITPDGCYGVSDDGRRFSSSGWRIISREELRGLLKSEI